jgi:hypothetical protein
MNKNQIKHDIDVAPNQAIIETEISLYQSDIRTESSKHLVKIESEAKRQKLGRITMVAILRK